MLSAVELISLIIRILEFNFLNYSVIEPFGILFDFVHLFVVISMSVRTPSVWQFDF